MKRRSVLFGSVVATLLLLLAVAVTCSRTAWGQAPPEHADASPLPLTPPAPSAASPLAAKLAEAEGIDGLLKRLQDIRAQKAELARQKARLDKAEAETTEQLGERFHQLKERLKKAGVAIEPVYGEQSVPMPPPGAPSSGANYYPPPSGTPVVPAPSQG